VFGVNEYMGPLDGEVNGTSDMNPGGVIFEIDIEYEAEIQDDYNITLFKTVYCGDDSDAGCPGGELVEGVNGETVIYCYTVTNTGDPDTYVNDIGINDPDLGIDETDMTLISADDDPLGNGESISYYYKTEITGDLKNTAEAIANPCDENGNDLPDEDKVTAKDTAEVNEIHPGIEIEKTVYAGHDEPDGDNCPGGELVVGGNGDPVTYCFKVMNTGDTYLKEVKVTDTLLGIDETYTDTGGLLAEGAAWEFCAETTITETLVNTAEAEGNPCVGVAVKNGAVPGDDLPCVDNVTDSDTAAVVVCETCEPCDPQGGCDTAFAYDGDVATCFLYIDKLGSNRWGWTNGPLGPGTYTFDVYAGAGQCDLSKGTLVGTVTVDYDGSTATVTYNINPDCTMSEAHVYVGSIQLPEKDGSPTVAPGQYPASGTTAGPYEVSDLSGDIYVIAHAVVCCDSPE